MSTARITANPHPQNPLLKWNVAIVFIIVILQLKSGVKSSRTEILSPSKVRAPLKEKHFSPLPLTLLQLLLFWFLKKHCSRKERRLEEEPKVVLIFFFLPRHDF